MCPARSCATCPPACEPADGQPAPSVRMRSTPIAATTMTNTASKFARLGSSRSSPVAASNMIPGWACTAGSLSRVSPYCTGSAGSASDGKSAATSTKPSSASPAPSSAGDASTTSQTVRSSKGRSATMQKSHICRPAIFIRLQAEAELSGGSARAYLADLSPHQRPSHPGRPRHDSEPGLHIYPGHRVPGTCASAAGLPQLTEGCRRKRGRQRGSDLARVHFDDVFPHGPQQAQELVLFGFPDLEVVEHHDEVFHEGIELAVRHPHVGMRLLHAEPGVGARPAGVLAQLIDELLGQPLQVRPGELLIDAAVAPRALIKGAGGRRDGLDSAEPLIQGTLHRSHLPCSRP